MNTVSSLRLFGLGLSLAGLAASLNVESKVRAEPTDHKASDVVAHFVDLFNGRDLSGWVNVKFVNSIRDSSIRKGYLCLESEGSEIHFRNIRILELPGGITATEQTAKVIK